MLETNEHNFSEENKAQVHFKTETKGDDIREEIEDNAIRFFFQSKTLKVHAEKLKEDLTYALKEANGEKIYQKEEKYQVLELQEYMGKIIFKLVTLKSSTCLNMQRLREEPDGELNYAKDNGTT